MQQAQPWGLSALSVRVQGPARTGARDVHAHNAGWRQFLSCSAPGHHEHGRRRLAPRARHEQRWRGRWEGLHRKEAAPVVDAPHGSGNGLSASFSRCGTAHCELNWPALAPPAAAAPPVRRQAQDRCSTGNAGCTQYQHVHATPGEWEGANRSLVACDPCFAQALFSRGRDATGPVLHCPAARLFVKLPCQGHTCGLAR